MLITTASSAIPRVVNVLEVLFIVPNVTLDLISKETFARINAIRDITLILEVKIYFHVYNAQQIVKTVIPNHA